MAQIGINIEASASQDVDLDTPQLLVDQSAEAKKAQLSSDVGHKLELDNVYTPQYDASKESQKQEQHKSAIQGHSNTLQFIEPGNYEEEHKLAMDFQRSSTMPLEYTKNLMNKLEFEHEFDTDDNQIKIQVFDLRKPEETKEIPLIAPLWEEKKVPLSGIDPLAGKLKSKLAEKVTPARRSLPNMKQFKRKNTFERSYTSDEVTAPITVSVTAIAQEGEDYSDDQIPLIQDIWGAQQYIESGQDVQINKEYQRRKSEIEEQEKQRECEYDPSQRVYYSPEGKRQINKRTSTVKYESMDDDQLEVMKIEVNDLRDEEFDSDLEQADTPLIAQIWGSKNELDEIIERRSSEKKLQEESEIKQQQAPIIVQFEEEVKERPKPRVETEEDEDDYMEGLDTVDQMDNHLIFYEPKASQPNLTRPAKQSLMRSAYFGMDVNKKSSTPNFYSSVHLEGGYKRADSRGVQSEGAPQRPNLLSEAAAMEDIRFEGELPSPPNRFNKNNKLIKSDGDYTLGNSQIDISQDELGLQELKEFSPLSSPKRQLVFDRIIKILGQEDFEMFVMVLIEYVPLQSSLRVTLNLDLQSFLKFFEDFQEHLQIPKAEASSLFKKNATGNFVSLYKFIELIKEIAGRNQYFNRDSLQILLSQILSKCERMKLLRKFREIKIHKSEAESGLSIQGLLQERDVQLRLLFNSYCEKGSSGARIMKPTAFLRLFQKKKVIPELLSVTESNKLFFFGQNISSSSFLKEGVDFERFKIILAFMAVESMKKQRGKEAVGSMLKLILDE